MIFSFHPFYRITNTTFSPFFSFFRTSAVLPSNARGRHARTSSAPSRLPSPQSRTPLRRSAGHSSFRRRASSGKAGWAGSGRRSPDGGMDLRSSPLPGNDGHRAGWPQRARACRTGVPRNQSGKLGRADQGGSGRALSRSRGRPGKRPLELRARRRRILCHARLARVQRPVPTPCRHESTTPTPFLWLIPE